MRLLFDTHVFLWWLADDSRLTARARRIIEDADNEIFLSAASALEIAIKTQLGKLRLPYRPEMFIAEQLSRNGFTPLAVSVGHALHVCELPMLHRDPFDRLLVAQSMLEKLPILTADPQIVRYPVETLW